MPPLAPRPPSPRVRPRVRLAKESGSLHTPAPQPLTLTTRRPSSPWTPTARATWTARSTSRSRWWCVGDPHPDAASAAGTALLPEALCIICHAGQQVQHFMPHLLARASFTPCQASLRKHVAPAGTNQHDTHSHLLCLCLFPPCQPCLALNFYMHTFPPPSQDTPSFHLLTDVLLRHA